MKRIVCLLIILCLAFGLMAGCGSTSASTQDASAASAASAAASEETPEAEPEAEPETAVPEGSAVEPDSSAEELEAPEDDGRPFPAPANPLTYPVADGDVTFTYCYEHMPILNAMGIDDYSENPAWLYAQEATGVNLEFVPLATGSSYNTMSLWIASGDLPDITAVFTYTDGLDAAVEDDLIVSLEGKEEHYPDYRAMLDSNEEFCKECLSDSGKLHTFNLMTNEPRRTTRGLMIRQDWLGALGMDIPETIDELTAVLRAFKANYNAGIGLYSGMATDSYSLCNAYGIAAFNTFQKYWYQVDGDVRMGMIQPEYKDYLTLLHGWYEEGLLNEEIMMTAGLAMNGDSDQVNGSQIGVWFGWIDSIPAWTETIGGDVKITAMPDPVMNKGDILKLGGNTGSVKGDEGFLITTCCADPDTAIEFMNWFYTEDGIITANYGVEGVTFEYNEEGKPEFNDVIIHNELGLPAVNATQAFAIYSIGTYQYIDRYDVMYTEEELQAFSIVDAHKTAEYNYSDYVTLTTEESGTYSTIISDVNTYLSTAVLSFVTGDRSLDEFDQYVSELKAMNLDEAIKIKQEAYNRWAGVSE